MEDVLSAMGWIEVRRRSLLVACCGGAVALSIIGLKRWPIEWVDRTPIDSQGRRAHRPEGRHEFIRAEDRGEAALAAADYLVAALLFTAGIVFWFAGAPKGSRIRDLARARWKAGLTPAILICFSLAGAGFMGLWGLGALFTLLGG